MWRFKLRYIAPYLSRIILIFSSFLSIFLISIFPIPVHKFVLTHAQGLNCLVNFASFDWRARDRVLNTGRFDEFVDFFAYSKDREVSLWNSAARELCEAFTYEKLYLNKFLSHIFLKLGL